MPTERLVVGERQPHHECPVAPVNDGQWRMRHGSKDTTQRDSQYREAEKGV